MSQERVLAAIMFTDLVGYTTLMGSDERKGMELVHRNKKVQKPLVEKYGGTWLKEMGDGVMSSFTTASDAIYCAMEIQKALKEDPDLNLRIGIHLGEVILEEGDVYGDGVNIASRIESIAEPGGIYISDSVQKAIRANTDIQYALLGELELKNVDYPVKTYALRGEFLPRPKKTQEKHLSGRLMAELSRRNVFRAGLAYLAVAFIVYSLLNFVDLNAAIENTIYGILILGIPISIYFAWNYERSPEGFVRVTSRKAWINPYSGTQKKPFTGNGVIVILLIIIVGFVVYPRFSSNNQDQLITTDGTSISNKKSIAVLPFDNLSNDPEQQYFTDGIQEDILNNLSKIAGLNVKSRSSTLRYRENRPGIAQIGEDLGVGTILEGSVRKSRNMVRISAQLIDVETDNHIWSETYDRELTEIFAIQSEVAREIARVLELKLLPGKGDGIFTMGTENITAYDYYLRARELSNNLNYRDHNSLNNIIELLQQAIKMDSGFAEAYALLSDELYSFGVMFSREIWLDSTLILANKAIELGPKIANGYVIRGQIIDNSFGDHTKAGEDFEKAYLLEPNNPNVLRRLGYYLIDNDDPERGVPMIIKSIELNWSKKDPQYYVEWGNIYRYAGEFNKARDLYLKAKKLGPELDAPNFELGSLSNLEGNYLDAIKYFLQTNSIDNIAWNYYWAGDLDKAEEYWLQLLKEEANLQDTTQYFAVRHRLGMVYWEKGDKKEAMKYFNEQIRLNQQDIDQQQVPYWGANLAGSYYDLSLTKAYLGDTEEAIKLIETEDIFWPNPLNMPWWLDTDPMLKSIRDDPRFVKVADRVRNKAEAAIKIFRQIINEREASEQMKLGLDK